MNINIDFKIMDGICLAIAIIRAKVFIPCEKHVNELGTGCE
jgi:hypothetical protein